MNEYVSFYIIGKLQVFFLKPDVILKFYLLKPNTLSSTMVILIVTMGIVGKRLGNVGLKMLKTIITEAAFFSTWVFLHEHSQFTGKQNRMEAISLTPLNHFHPFQKHLDINQVITVESSTLNIARSQNRTGNLSFQAQIAYH